jgi:membrane-associated protein
MAGLYAAKGDLSIFWLNALLIPCAIIGDATSYYIGARTGPVLFNRPRSRIFRPEHVRAAHEFYEKHGGKAIILARFMPLVRTFVPVVAGVAGMSYRKFASYNVIGGAAWVLSMTLIGYVLGVRFPLLVAHIEKVIIVVVLLSVTPALVEWARAKRRARAAADGETHRAA